jgi:GNAT superfamily N-acetyltransferase
MSAAEGAEAADAVVFAGGGLAARPLRRDEIPQLQAFYDANPEYFLTVNGRRPPPDLASIEFDEAPPAHLPFDRQWCLGLFEQTVQRADGVPAPPPPQAPLGGVAMVTTNLCTAGVWHIGLFIVATREHGRGVAPLAYGALEGWARSSGAQFLRLAVVRGNVRAERFWQRQGYVQLRVREGVDTGGRINTVRLMLKPLHAGGPPGSEAFGRAVDAYLEAVPRDRPDSLLP